MPTRGLSPKLPIHRATGQRESGDTRRTPQYRYDRGSAPTCLAALQGIPATAPCTGIPCPASAGASASDSGVTICADTLDVRPLTDASSTVAPASPSVKDRRQHAITPRMVMLRSRLTARRTDSSRFTSRGVWRGRLEGVGPTTGGFDGRIHRAHQRAGGGHPAIHYTTRGLSPRTAPVAQYSRTQRRP
jgi:hypothetical protein